MTHRHRTCLRLAFTATIDQVLRTSSALDLLGADRTAARHPRGRRRYSAGMAEGSPTHANGPFSQAKYQVRFDHGAAAASRIAGGADIAVWVDALGPEIAGLDTTGLDIPERHLEVPSNSSTRSPPSAPSWHPASSTPTPWRRGSSPNRSASDAAPTSRLWRPASRAARSTRPTCSRRARSSTRSPSSASTTPLPRPPLRAPHSRGFVARSDTS